MAALFLPDLIHQCRLARWEEEYCIMDTLEIPPAQKVSYPLLLCAGQEIKVKICASDSVEASIGFESREPGIEAPEPFNFNPEASCFVIDHEAKRTAYYLLAIVNNSAESIDVTVEIAASLREPALRIRFESVCPVFDECLPSPPALLSGDNPIRTRCNHRDKNPTMIRAPLGGGGPEVRDE